jgi:hypothetical protein
MTSALAGLGTENREPVPAAARDEHEVAGPGGPAIVCAEQFDRAGERVRHLVLVVMAMAGARISRLDRRCR